VSDSTADPRRLRVRAGLAFVQVLRPALYVLLVASAVFTFWAGGDIAGHELPLWAQAAAPLLFALFMAVFAVYRFALVRAKKYPAATGLFQVGLGALIWVMLLPGTRNKIALHAQPADQVPSLLESPDARVRALAAEVAGYREGGSRYAAGLIDRLSDADPRVREMAHASLARLAGTDAGQGAEAWRALARQRGWIQ
jgi:hypothetical protein